MTIECYCGYEMYSRYKAIRPISRKKYECQECGGPINPGDRYEWARGHMDGYWSLHRTCPCCLAQRDMIEARVPCFCSAHGDFIDRMNDLLFEYGHELPGLQFALGRLRVEANKLLKKAAA
jgi:hypothetical protein